MNVSKKDFRSLHDVIATCLQVLRVSQDLVATFDFNKFLFETGWMRTALMQIQHPTASSIYLCNLEYY